MSLKNLNLPPVSSADPLINDWLSSHAPPFKIPSAGMERGKNQPIQNQIRRGPPRERFRSFYKEVAGKNMSLRRGDLMWQEPVGKQHRHNSF